MNPPAVYDDFETYALAHPGAEEYRAWLTRGLGADALFALVKIEDTDCFNHFPGGYLALRLFSLVERIPATEIKAGGRTSRKDRPTRVAGWRVMLHDNDDGCSERDFPPDQDGAARQLYSDIKASAPFAYADAQAVFFPEPAASRKPKRSR